MSLSLISPSAQEPVLLDDLKQHLRLSSNDDDIALSGLAIAARHALEARVGFAFLAQQWRFQVETGKQQNASDQKGYRDIILPVTPVLSIDAVEAVYKDGQREIIFQDDYEVMTGSVGRVKLLAPLPLGIKHFGGIEITFTAGHHSVEDIPAELRHAIRLLTAHFYENRESASEERVFSIPRSIDALLAPYRRLSL